MNPMLMAAPAFAATPVLGLVVLAGASAFSLGIVLALNNEEKNKSHLENPTPPVKEAIKQLQQIETKANDTIQHQKATVKIATSTLKHETQRLDQTTNKIERAAKTIETQAEHAQIHIHEMNRLRSSVALTNAALKANQKTLDKSEAKLSETAHQLIKIQQQLDENVATHHAAASKVLKQTIRLHDTQTKIIEPLLKSKDEEIAGLRKTLRVINSHVNRFPQEEFFKSNANKTTERNQNSDMDNQNQGVNHASFK
jgi:DNA repair exonuclease SbcCD ATPase subunit